MEGIGIKEATFTEMLMDRILFRAYNRRQVTGNTEKVEQLFFTMTTVRLGRKKLTNLGILIPYFTEMEVQSLQIPAAHTF